MRTQSTQRRPHRSSNALARNPTLPPTLTNVILHPSNAENFLRKRKGAGGGERRKKEENWRGGRREGGEGEKEGGASVFLPDTVSNAISNANAGEPATSNAILNLVRSRRNSTGQPERRRWTRYRASGFVTHETVGGFDPTPNPMPTPAGETRAIFNLARQCRDFVRSSKRPPRTHPDGYGLAGRGHVGETDPTPCGPAIQRHMKPRRTASRLTTLAFRAVSGIPLKSQPDK